jgi:hypothetical protein
MLFRLVITSHVSFVFTKSNFLQLLTIPGCVGVGVCTPFGGCVGVGVGVVGVWPMMETQAYVSAHMPLQVLPAEGFQVVSWAVVMPLLLAMESHVSPVLTK